MTSLAQYQLGHQRQLTTCYTNPWIVAITNIQVSTFTFLHNLCGLLFWLSYVKKYDNKRKYTCIKHQGSNPRNQNLLKLSSKLKLA
jgi:hypothetical protein